MSVERRGQAVVVEASKGQLVTGGARGFDEGRQLFIDGTSRMNREVQVQIGEGLGVKFPGPTRRSTYHKPGIARSNRSVSQKNLFVVMFLASRWRIFEA
jgi:hypothetical protein